MFHNAGPFTGDTFHWLLIGLSLAAYRVARMKNAESGFDGSVEPPLALGLQEELFRTDGDIQR